MKQQKKEKKEIIQLVTKSEESQFLLLTNKLKGLCLVHNYSNLENQLNPN